MNDANQTGQMDRREGRWRLEPRLTPNRWVVGFVSLGSVVAALVVTGIIFAAYGFNPLQAYRDILAGTFVDWRGTAEVIRRAIPLLLAGVGILLALKARFWNIGAEGQILAGAVAASGVALFVPVPAPLMIPTLFIVGFLGGALWSFVPAILKVKLGVNEIITTLMMNYIALYLVQWLINGPWKGLTTRGFARSDPFPDIAELPTWGVTRLHWPTLLLGVLFAIGVAFLLSRTKLGFEIRMMGESPEAARYAGVDFFRTTLLLMLIAGGAAGVAGVGEVAGIHHRLVDPNEISLGYGYTAIIVALLARGSSLAAIVTALFLGLVFASGDVMRVVLRLPVQMTEVISGLVLFFVICSEPLMRYTLRWVPKEDAGRGANEVGSSPPPPATVSEPVSEGD